MGRFFLVTVALMFAITPPALSAEKKATKDKAATWDIEQPDVEADVINIDTRTGTWMNLDLSPDGSWIVFDLLGDLYRLPVGGGKAKALTQGLAWDMQPRISPDGQRIAFTSDRAGGDNIWTMDVSGKDLKQVTKETYRLMTAPAWSPDGQWLVARKHFTSRRSIGAGEMWLYHPDGGQGVQLTKRKTSQKDEGEPVFSPDGRYIYYSRDATPGEHFKYNKDSSTGIYVIERLDRLKGTIKRIAGGPGGAIRPTPSPDGLSMAFVRRHRGRSALYIRDLKSGVETRLTDKLERDMQETWAIHGVYPQMAFGPDSRWLLFWAQGKIHRIDLESRKVRNIPFHVASTRRQLKPVRFPVEVAPHQFPVRLLRWPQLTDRNQVVFQALGRLYTRPLAGGAPKALTRETQDFEFYPSLTRDGKSVVYTQWSDDDLGSIRRVSIKGGKGKVLTREPGHYVEPALSPDGKTLVYRRVPSGWLTSPHWSTKKGIFSLNLKTGEEREISASGLAPHFGMDSDRVFFLEVGPKDVRWLKSTRLDGTKARTHIESKEATEFRVSPDGTHLVFAEGFQIYATPFPSTALTRSLGPKDKALPLVRLSSDSGFHPVFTNDSRRILWQLGSELFVANVKDVFARPKESKEGEAETKSKDAESEDKSSKATSYDFVFRVPYAKPQGAIAVVGARLVTMRGDEVIEDGVLVVEGNRIVAVGPRGDVKVPAGAHVIDGKGLTAIPGIVDVHAHGAQAAYGINPQRSWHNYATLAFGVTTIHDPSNRSESIFSASELVKAGRTVGPRIFSTGTILYGASGSFRAQINGLEDARKHLRRMKAMGAFSVKSYNQPRRNQRQQVLQAARELKMAVVPEGGALYQHNMSMVADGHTGVEHALSVAHAYDDVLQFWSKTKVGYTPTFNVAYGGLKGEDYWYQERPIYEHERLLRFVPTRALDARARRPHLAPAHEWNHVDVAKFANRLSAAGGMVQVGGHGQREGLGAHWEIWSFAQGGMSPHRALRAATLGGAEYLGMTKDLGTLDSGKLADIALIEGNPLVDIRRSEHVRWVLANGRLYDAATMSEHGANKGNAPRFFFHRDGSGEDAETRAEGLCHGCQ
jgi:Tol biopolymer transport system component/imidazolonepropionase-like amidohydrolase